MSNLPAGRQVLNAECRTRLVAGRYEMQMNLHLKERSRVRGE